MPELKKDEVLVKVSYAGICKSDLKVARGELPCKDDGVVLGHEFSGVVVEKDPRIGNRLKLGDKVTANLMLDDVSDRMLGKDADGCFAEYVAVPFQNLEKLFRQHDESDMQMKLAAYTEPVAAALGAAESFNGEDLKPSDEVIIAGDPNDRIAKLIEFFLDKMPRKWTSRIVSPEKLLIDLDLGKQKLFKCIIECCPEKAGKLMRCLAKNGTMVLKSRGYVGLDGVLVNDIVMRQLTILGAKYANFTKALEMIWKYESSLINMISWRDYALDDFESAFAEASGPGAKKVMFRCAQQLDL